MVQRMNEVPLVPSSDAQRYFVSYPFNIVQRPLIFSNYSVIKGHMSYMCRTHLEPMSGSEIVFIPVPRVS